jgi:hypothetical protein
MLGLKKRSIIGIILMIVGTVAFLPSVFAGTTRTVDLTAVAAAALLTIGTYLVGTDIDGRPV